MDENTEEPKKVIVMLADETLRIQEEKKAEAAKALEEVETKPEPVKVEIVSAPAAPVPMSYATIDDDLVVDDATDQVSLTDAQEKVLEMAIELKKDALSGDPSIGILTGFAGTGKTTVIRSIFKHLRGATVLAPTGKAAQRVRQHAKVPAKTIHSWMYFPHEDPKTGVMAWERKPQEVMEKEFTPLIVVDEASMLDEELWNDLLSSAIELGSSIMLVGDPAQLPPVNGGGKFDIFSESFEVDYRCHLGTVLRQALDSPIIRASMLIREGKTNEGLALLYHIQPRQLNEHIDWTLENGGVVLCHANATRHRLNAQARGRRGYTPDSEIRDGEPLLIMKNNQRANVFNGEVIRFHGWEKLTTKRYKAVDDVLKAEGNTRFGVGVIGEPVGRMPARRAFLAEGEVYGQMDRIRHTVLMKSLGAACKELDTKPDMFAFLQANLGYALTCHKAQGSEWDNVLVHLDRTVNLMEEPERWIYTAVTRAKKNVGIYYG